MPDAAAATWWSPQGLSASGAADPTVLHRPPRAATASTVRSGRRVRWPRGARDFTGKLTSGAVGSTPARRPPPLAGSSPSLGVEAIGLGAAVRLVRFRDGGSAEHLNEAPSVAAAAMNDAALRPRRSSSPTNFTRLWMGNPRSGATERRGMPGFQRGAARPRVGGRNASRPCGAAAAAK